LLPLLSALVVLGAIGLAAWMLLTSGDDAEVTDDPPAVTQPTAGTPTPTPSDTGDGGGDDGDKNGGDKNGGDKNGGDKNGGDKNGGDKNGGDKNGGDKNGGDKNGGDKNGGDKNGGDKNDPNSTGPVPQIPIYVFNQTTLAGLAAQTGAELEASGWNVVGVDNWVGTVPEDTVYFYPGDRAAAERLSRSFDIGRVWPASAPMPAGALTVILATTDRK
jgi:hypothetical protein